MASAQNAKQTSATGDPGGDNLQITAVPSAFTYQGKLSDGGNSANGLYDMQFKLFDDASNGNQIPLQSPLTVERANVQVTNGVFTVQLDFGVNHFESSNRYLDISVRHAAANEQYTTLAPRQQILSAPYAIRSNSAFSADFATTATNSFQLGGVSASQYVKTDDARLTDARTPAAGGNSYIQNTTQQQTGADFNISGNGTLSGTLSANAVGGNTVNATTEYSFNNQKFLSAPGLNTTVGVGAGHSSAGASNAFFGNASGAANTTGSNNLFAGASAGKANQSGSRNAFAGFGAGLSNVSGNDNSFFGTHAGNQNTAHGNSFFGSFAGELNTTGAGNAFFGLSSGQYNTTGQDNSYFGVNAGQSNDAGQGNSLFGKDAGTLNTGNYNSMFGAFSGAANSTGAGNAFFGYAAGKANTTGGGNTFIGEGAGLSNTTGNVNTFIGVEAGRNNTTGFSNIYIGNSAAPNGQTSSRNTVVGSGAGLNIDTEQSNTLIGYQANIIKGVNNSTAIGASAGVTQSNSLVLGDTNVSVGIGVTAPKAKLHVAGGNIYVGDAGQGMILKSPNGSVCRLLTIDNSGAMSLTPISCP
jgi:hypothetical protein